MLICLHSVCACFCGTRAELSPNSLDLYGRSLQTPVLKPRASKKKKNSWTGQETAPRPRWSGRLTQSPDLRLCTGETPAGHAGSPPSWTGPVMGGGRERNLQADLRQPGPGLGPTVLTGGDRKPCQVCPCPRALTGQGQGGEEEHVPWLGTRPSSCQVPFGAGGDPEIF